MNENVKGFYAKPVALSSIDDTWTTPKDFFDKVSEEFNFVLDAAALQSSALCERWYGPDHPNESRRDAFTHDWSKDSEDGAVWLNPPYGKTIRKWMAKAKSDVLDNGALVVALVPSRTDTRWFHESCINFEVRFIKGRLKFGGGNPAPFPSALVVMSRETWKPDRILV